MSVAAIGAILLGEYEEAVAIMILYQVGEKFEDYAVDKSRDSIEEIAKLRPDHATIKIGAETCDVTPDEVEAAEEGDKKAAEHVAGAAKLMDDISVEGEKEVEFNEEKRERKSGITDDITDEIGDSIAGEDFEKTKKKSKKLREQEEQERKEQEKAKLDELEGDELTKYMAEHPDLIVNAFEDPANFFNGYNFVDHLDEYRDG